MKEAVYSTFSPEENRQTLDQWYRHWIENYKKDSVKIGTYQSYQQYYNSIIKKKLGDVPLADIHPEQIQNLYNDLVRSGYSVSTVKIVASILGGCLGQAVRNGLISQNPVRLAVLPREQRRKERPCLSRAEQALFFEHAADSYLFPLFQLLLRTGLRSGEARALKPCDIDFEKHILHVTKTLKYQSGVGYFEDSPKTRSSYRDIPLTEGTLSPLRAHVEKMSTVDSYLFTAKSGRPLSKDDLQYEIDRIVEEIRSGGKPFEHITPHIFRHTFATRAIESGMQPQVLKTILGHSSLAMTMDLYSHVLPETRFSEMEKIESAFLPNK